MKPDKEGTRIAARMLEVRQRLGLTQSGMAYYFSISRITYIRWEHIGPPNRPYQRMAVKLLLQKLGVRARHKLHDAKPHRRLSRMKKHRRRKLGTITDPTTRRPVSV